MTTQNHMPRHRKILQLGLTVVLWLITVILGFVAVRELINGIDAQVLTYIFDSVVDKQMGQLEASRLSLYTNFASILCSGLLWIGMVVIFGIDYHLKRIGQRRSYVVFALTIGIEFILFWIGNLLQTT